MKAPQVSCNKGLVGPIGAQADKATFALHDMATFRHAEGRILSNMPTERKCIILKVLILPMRNQLRVGE